MNEPSDPRKLSEVLPTPSEDPAPLRAMLLAAGPDVQVRAEISRAYWSVMEGAKFSPSVLHGILLSAIYNAIAAQTTNAGVSSNGSHPAHSEDHEAARAEIIQLVQTVRGVGESMSKVERRFILATDTLTKLEERCRSLDEVTTTFAGVARKQLWLLLASAFLAGILCVPFTSLLIDGIRAAFHI